MKRIRNLTWEFQKLLNKSDLQIILFFYEILIAYRINMIIIEKKN